MTNQLSISLDEQEPQEDFVQLHHVIIDRGSKYSVTMGRVEGKDDMKKFMDRLLKNKKYAKATHNTYAVRMTKEGKLWEGKRDDGETGAGMVILRLLKKRNLTNIIVVVTRWYGGTKLGADRFKHVQDAAMKVLETIA